MNEPMPSEPSGAIHQKRGLANTVLTPAHCAAIPPLVAGGAVSGTRHQIQAAMPKANTDSTMNTPRQSVNRSAISTGVVATSAPTPPATMIQAASDACRSAGYHAEIAFSGAIRQTDTPSADQRTRDDEPGDAVRQREGQRADAAEQQQRRLHAPRTVAVEQHPGRNLHRAEGDEVGAGQQSERARREPELPRQFRRDHRVDGTQQVGKKVAGREGEVDVDERYRLGGHGVGVRAVAGRRLCHQVRKMNVMNRFDTREQRRAGERGVCGDGGEEVHGTGFDAARWAAGANASPASPPIIPDAAGARRFAASSRARRPQA